MRIIEREAKSIYTKTKNSELEYTINQYVGCGHKCIYCYAKYMSEWKNYGPWGSWIEVKINAPELVKKKVSGEVSMSSVSDPYQPLEKELKLTRRVLENMNKEIKLSILSKSDLILRDIDLLKEFKNLKVGLTINCFSEEVRKILEPYAPSNENRIKTLKELHLRGIKTFCFISPVIPLLTELRKVLSLTRGFVNYYLIEILNTNLGGEELREILKNKFSESYEFLKSRKKMEFFSKQLKAYLWQKKIPVKCFIEHSKENYYN
ncbi:MAG: radical SAM protein [candidate division WOR-3 bacterium]